MSQHESLLAAIAESRAVVGVVGLGYVGLPLAMETARSGYRTLGLDVSTRVVDGLNGKRSHIQDVPSDLVATHVTAGTFSATADMQRLAECDVISICVPTPLAKTKDPDMSYIVAAADALLAALRPGQLIILESTTFPGTTREVLKPVLEKSGLRAGEDFFLCFSPERVDPGNATWQTRNTPKVIGGLTPACLEAGMAIYSRVFDTMVPVESAEAAELVKLYENTFRMINIALANEMAQACERLGIDVWGMIDAAATKPFGFMKFTPGPGLGGHCIPLDPHYLAWKMRTLQYKTRMIELASEINTEMPDYVVVKASDALNAEGKALNGSRVLVLGVAYKKDIDDLRESPALEIIDMLQKKGAHISYHDSYCHEIRDDGHTPIRNLPMHSIELTAQTLGATDLVLIVTDHSEVDYQLVADHAALVVDTRGVMRRVKGKAKVVGLSGTHQPSREARVTVAH
ncbi:MAG: wecC [Gemmatimonadetes bacterium]|jgi:UDP-N-acetyl-D-glucosamine dehydrogenase|nr:wecC [Gemmatimonadota bacterium]